MGGHDHHSHGVSKPRAMGTALGITLFVLVIEVAGGLWTGSLALLADAGHMGTDAVALCLGLFALWVARRPPDRVRTFGYHRAEVLAALANGAFLLVLIGALLREALGRLLSPPEVKSLPTLPGIINKLTEMAQSGKAENDPNQMPTRFMLLYGMDDRKLQEIDEHPDNFDLPVSYHLQ